MTGIPSSVPPSKPPDDKTKFLKKEQTCKVEYQGVTYSISYKKDAAISNIFVTAVQQENPGQDKLSKLAHKSFSVKEMIQEVTAYGDSPLGKAFDEILKKEGLISLGKTDLGEWDSQQSVYQVKTKNNLDDFAASMKSTNYQSWAELEKWEEGDVDWKDVIYPRFELVKAFPFGVITFNLSGMKKEKIEKAQKLDFRMTTGETERSWGKKDNIAPSTWKAEFGLSSLTLWELMQVSKDPKLLERTEFYEYDRSENPAPVKLTKEEVRSKYGLQI